MITCQFKAALRLLTIIGAMSLMPACEKEVPGTPEGSEPTQQQAHETTEEPSEVDVVLIIPDDYVGLLRIRADPMANVEISKGTTRVAFRDGLALVKSTQPLTEWHGTIAESVSGASIPFEHVALSEPYDDRNRTVYGLGASQYGTHFYFVGSEQALSERLEDESFLFER